MVSFAEKIEENQKAAEKDRLLYEKDLKDFQEFLDSIQLFRPSGIKNT